MASSNAGSAAPSCRANKGHPPERLRRFPPPLSQRCALRAGGRRPRCGAALARRPWPWARQ
ncbi:MAG: hypothetical protein B7Y46_15395, partial [Acidovorax sp. 28-64-14]